MKKLKLLAFILQAALGFTSSNVIRILNRFQIIYNDSFRFP